MGIKERKEREKEQRRQDILDAAEKIFFRKGFQDTTVDDIAEQAELSKGTVYLYFKSKEELASAIVYHGISIMNDAFRKASDSREKGIEKIEEIGKAFFTFYREHTDHARFMRSLGQLRQQGHSCGQQKKIAKKSGEGMQIMAEAITAGQKDGSIRKDLDPLMTALALAAFSQGILEMITLKGDAVEAVLNRKISEFTDFTFQFMCKGLE